MASPPKDLAPDVPTTIVTPDTTVTESGAGAAAAKPETNTTLGGDGAGTTTRRAATFSVSPSQSQQQSGTNGGSGSGGGSVKSAAANRNSTADIDTTNPLDFSEDVSADNSLPTLATLKKIDNYIVLDRNGKSHTFRSLYTGRHVARRVLLVFVRHFYCGVCVLSVYPSRGMIDD